MKKTAMILLALAGLMACRKPLEFPFVQKYQVTAGDLFYFRPDGQFVLLERRGALDITVAEVGWQAYLYPDRITISRPMENKPGQFWGSGNAGEMLENTPFTTTPSPMSVLVWGPTVGRLAGGGPDGKITVWDLATGAPPLELAEDVEIKALAFSPDGSTLAVGLGRHILGTHIAINPATVRLWSYPGGQLGDTFGTEAVTALVFARDGRLAVGFEDGSVLLRPAGGGALHPVHVSTAAVTSLAVHPYGAVFASGHADKKIYLWKADTGEVIAAFPPDIPPNPLFPRGIERIGFSADGTRFAAAYSDGEMRIWNSSALIPQPKK